MTQSNVFLSYSRLDRGVVTPLATLLRGTGAAIFRDEDSITPGEKWQQAVVEAIQSCESILVFWSAAAVDSKAVEEEYTLAITLGKRVVPVLLDDTPLLGALRQYQWVDLRTVINSATIRAIATSVAGVPALAAALIPAIGPIVLGALLASKIASIFNRSQVLNVQLEPDEQKAVGRALLSMLQLLPSSPMEPSSC